MKKLLQVAKTTFKKVSNNKIILLDISKININDELASVFEQDKDVVERLVADMKKNGFSKAHPIHVFWYNGKLYLVDGHTRFTAAKKAGITKVYVQIHDFNNIAEAKLFSMQEQFNRRNTNDATLLNEYLTLMDNNYSVKDIAEKTKTSKRQIYKVKETVEKASPEQIESVSKGTTTINQLYKEIKEKENKQKAEAEKVQSQEIKVANLIDNTKFQKADSTPVEAKFTLSKTDIFKLGIKFAYLKSGKTFDLNTVLSDTLHEPLNLKQISEQINSEVI